MMAKTNSEEDFELRGDEQMVLVIRAHLIAERTVYKILTEALVLPNAIDLDRLTLLVKVRLAVAMGLVPEMAIPCLTVLNSIRNKFAHNADYRFSDKDKGELLSAMPAHAAQVALEESEDVVYTRESIPIERVLKVLVALVEAFRRRARNARADREAAAKLLQEEVAKSWKMLGK